MDQVKQKSILLNKSGSVKGNQAPFFAEQAAYVGEEVANFPLFRISPPFEVIGQYSHVYSKNGFNPDDNLADVDLEIAPEMLIKLMTEKKQDPA